MGEDERRKFVEKYGAEVGSAISRQAAVYRTALTTLHAAGEQFAAYAEQHRAKGTPEADAKAEVNQAWAIRCFDACNAVAFSGDTIKPLIIMGDSRQDRPRRREHD